MKPSDIAKAAYRSATTEAQVRGYSFPDLRFLASAEARCNQAAMDPRAYAAKQGRLNGLVSHMLTMGCALEERITEDDKRREIFGLPL
jgi:hypothetical protein